ncbi:MAG TPA: hypothetical protein VH370_04395 [Humisphaera sp.]|jgi:hypothetical protein|nr:hypothetical protein [Humisphaera sp.]
MRKLFPPKVCERLGYYVYLYIDPRNGKPFYIGKGQGNRVFGHLRDSQDSEKVKVIKELEKQNREPILEILKYGLTESEALLVESTAIDLLDVQTLTNGVRGHGSRHGTRGRVEDIAAALSAQPAKFKHRCLLINIARGFHYGMSPQELYDATRSAWKLGKKRLRAQYAISVYQRVIREVYEIAGWLPGGTTMRSNDADGRHKTIPGRWEFVGRVAEHEIRKLYVGRSIADKMPAGAQNPIMYIGCD